MRFEDWKEMVKKASLGEKMSWLMDAYVAYQEKTEKRWECVKLMMLSNDFKEVMEIAKQEADDQLKRYEWLYEHIIETYSHKKNTAVDYAYHQPYVHMSKEAFNAIMANATNDSISAKVANNVKQLAKFHECQIGDVEKAINVSPGYISRCLTGHKRISIDVCYKLSLYFMITMEDLIENNWEEIKEDS